MGLIDRIFRSLTERAAKKHTLGQWPGILAQSGAMVDNRFTSAKETASNVNTGAHVIGIERWGQSRLRVFLGDELVMDEYDGYRPPAEDGVAAMIPLFEETRAETIRLAEALAEADIPDTQSVPHNCMGGLTTRGWLAYLDSHATRESSRMKN